MRLLGVLGASEALGDHLIRHPEHWRELRDPSLGSTRPAAYAVRCGLLRAVGADPDDPTPTATLPDAVAVDALRVEYRRVLLRLASRDLGHHLAVDDAAAELSDLAGGTLDAALAIARQRVGAPATTARLAVVAMGKCGGHELNYVSDVDVIFVAEAVAGRGRAGRPAGRHPAGLPPGADLWRPHRRGHIWPVDAALRPEGKAGPLVRTLASHRGYYERWAKTWEFQALLKARAVAGDLALGQEFVDLVAPMVWSVAERDGFVDDVQAMRRRVLDHIPAREAERQLKLGSGGLRDVEFAVQLLQLVHGRADEQLRQGATLSALAELTRGGYVGREDGEAMHAAYAYLRTLEHRIQLYQLRRTHVVPDDEDDLRRLGRSMGYLKDPVESLEPGLDAPPPRGAPAAREALLPAAAGRGRPDPRGGGAALAGGGRGPARRPRVRRPEGRAAPPRGPHRRGHPDLHDPAHAAAGAAGVVRGRTGPRRRALRLPPGQRGPRAEPVVPADAAGRGQGRRAPRPAAGHLPLRHRPAAARAAGGPAAR